MTYRAVDSTNSDPVGFKPESLLDGHRELTRLGSHQPEETTLYAQWPIGESLRWLLPPLHGTIFSLSALLESAQAAQSC